MTEPKRKKELKTLYVNPELAHLLKVDAVQQGITLQKLIDKIFKQYLDKKNEVKK
jgi:predicted HicB family RNase H-like nuclease